MRAIYLNKSKDFEIGEVLDVEGDSYNHLVRVCRIRIGESVKVLMGNSKSLECIVETISKRELSMRVNSLEVSERVYNIDLLLGLPKREAFELTLKNAIELGVTKLIPFLAEYSQWNIKNFDRLESLIESAVIQSNNPFSFTVENPLVDYIATTDLIRTYDHVFLTTLANKNLGFKNLDKANKILLIVGPEGGFSKKEEDFFLSFDNVITLNTMGPIMRTPNAVSTGVGFILGKIAAL